MTASLAHLKSKSAIERSAAAILHQHQVERFLGVRTIRHAQHWRRRGPGRPGKLPLYRNHFTISYRLVWPRQPDALQRERRLTAIHLDAQHDGQAEDVLTVRHREGDCAVDELPEEQHLLLVCLPKPLRRRQVA